MAHVTVQGSGAAYVNRCRTTVGGSHHRGVIKWLYEEELSLAEAIARELEKLTVMWPNKP